MEIVSSTGDSNANNSMHIKSDRGGLGWVSEIIWNCTHWSTVETLNELFNLVLYTLLK